MSDHVPSITFSGQPAPLLEASELSHDDLLTSDELGRWIEGGIDTPDGEGPVVLSTPDGSFYAVGSGQDGDGLSIQGVVPVPDANDELECSE